jgi:catechol 2,3-dioxygenase
VLGFDVMGLSQKFRAAFVSAGGYHHHLGLNTWQGEGAPPPPPDAAGLRYFTVQLPSQYAWEQVVNRVHEAGWPTEQSAEAAHNVIVRDPCQNTVHLTVAPSPKSP